MIRESDLLDFDTMAKTKTLRKAQRVVKKRLTRMVDQQPCEGDLATSLSRACRTIL